MRLSKKCSYAIRSLIFLSLRQEKNQTRSFELAQAGIDENKSFTKSLDYPPVAKPTQVREMAARQNIPLKFLQAILLDLKKAGYVDSLKGPGGGYFLVKKSNLITLKDVISYIDGAQYISYANKENYSPLKMPLPASKKDAYLSLEALNYFLYESSLLIDNFCQNTTIETLSKKIQTVTKAYAETYSI